MPRGVPRIGAGVGMARTSSAGELTEAPQPEFIGTIKPETLQPHRPSFEEDGPPPWEVDPKWAKHTTDARRFVDVPDRWELRWLNPRVIDQSGFRDWQTIAADDPRIVLKVPAMKAADNTIRRGGHGGPILCYMPKSWVESRQRLKADRAIKMTERAVDRQRQFTEEVNRGNFGPHIHADPGQHPTHTIAEGRTMEKD